MADRYLLESGAPDGYQLEDGTGVLLLETGNAPFIPQTWCNPRPVVRSNSTFMHRPALLTTGAGDFIFREPLFSPRRTIPDQPPQVFPNLLVTTLSQQANPFTTPIWPNPQVRIAAQVFNAPNLLVTTLATLA